MKQVTKALIAISAASASASPSVAQPSFSPEAFRSHVAFLADDLLEGRDTGSRGHEIATRYVVAQFAAAGLVPAGADGGWYQPVKLREARLVEGRAAVTIGGRRHANGDAVFVGASLLDRRQTQTAGTVFAGHCLYEPKLGIDDFEGLDVAGKIVACLPGFPKTLPSEIAAYLVDQRARFVARRGGIGVITLWTAATEKRYPFARLVATQFNPRMERLNPDGTVHQFAPGLLTGATLAAPAARALFAGAAQSFDQVEAREGTPGVKGFPLRQSVTIERESELRDVVSHNVIGMVKGTDPKLSAQFVVLGAHLDHLGIGKPVNGDAIYNGALDNGAGTATMIEVARATAAAPPKRSVLFISATAEEKGLLGAEYFAANPTVPKDDIVSMIDLDMPLITYDFTDVVAYGADHSTVAEFVEAAAKDMKLKLSPDPIPEETIFVRSDHYAFVQRGVPAIALSTGYDGAGAEAWGTFLSKHYHQPSDDMTLPIRWTQGARFAELNWRIMARIADAPEPPRWYRGDYFGDLFAPSAPKAAKPQ